MYYVRTTGGSMMAITPKSKTVISSNKKPVNTAKEQKKMKSPSSQKPNS